METHLIENEIGIDSERERFTQCHFFSFFCNIFSSLAISLCHNKVFFDEYFLMFTDRCH